MKKQATLKSTVGSRKSKKTKRDIVTSIESLPRELLSEVSTRVEASSFTDVFNAKLSCKIFHEVAEDTRIYRHMSSDQFPLVAWKPINEKQQAFLSRCEEWQNPQVMYRQAVVDYFSGKGIEFPTPAWTGLVMSNKLLLLPS